MVLNRKQTWNKASLCGEDAHPPYRGREKWLSHLLRDHKEDDGEVNRDLRQESSDQSKNPYLRYAAQQASNSLLHTEVESEASQRQVALMEG